MQEHVHLPEMNRLSILSAMIMLAYALTPLITFPEQILSLNLFGIVFSYRYTFTTVVSILVAALAAIGTIYLLQTHPHFQNTRLWQHSILPALSAWAIGVPLSAIQVSLEWWGVFFIGGALLILVFVSEFIIVDPDDSRFPPATVAITVISFTLFFILSIGARTGMLRLYLLLPALVIPIYLISLRTLHLRHGNRWHFTWSVAISLFIGGIVLGLHYLPLSPVSFGFILLGVGYSITSLVSNITMDYPGRLFWVEPSLTGLLFLGLAIFIG
jgi:hypothetical protein